MDATTIAEKISAQQPEFGGTVWTMRDKTKIDVADMTPSHAANAATMLARSTRRMLDSLWFQYIEKNAPNLETAGELALEGFEMALDELDEIEPEDVLRATTLGAALYARAAEMEA